MLVSINNNDNFIQSTVLFSPTVKLIKGTSMTDF